MSTEQSIYLDTHNGLTGILPPSRSGAVLDIMPEIEHFNFTVMSMKGMSISTRIKKERQASSTGCIRVIRRIPLSVAYADQSGSRRGDGPKSRTARLL